MKNIDMYFWAPLEVCQNKSIFSLFPATLSTSHLRTGYIAEKYNVNNKTVGCHGYSTEKYYYYSHLCIMGDNVINCNKLTTL